MADAGNVGAEGERPTLQRQKSQSKMSAREELKIVMQSRSFKRGEGGDAADMDDRADAQSAASGKSAKSLGKSSNYSRRNQKLSRKLGKTTAVVVSDGDQLKFVFASNHPLYLRWNNVTFAAAWTSIILAPVRLAFTVSQDYDSGLFWIEFAMGCTFIVDLFLCMFCVLPESVVTVGRMDVLKAYVTSSDFPLDIVCAFPLDFISFYCGANIDAQFALGMLRLFRVKRIIRFVKAAEENTKIDYNFMRLAKVLVMILMICHLFACYFWFIAFRMEGVNSEQTWAGKGNREKLDQLQPQGTSGQYLVAIYFTLNSMASGGFGDYTPANTLEEVSSCFLVFVNYCVLVYVIGVMTNIVNALDEPVRAFHSQFKALQQYLDSHELPEDLCDELRVFTRLKFDSRDEHVEMLESFPPILRSRLFRVMYRPIIESVYILDKVTDTFIDVLSCGLQIEMIQGGIAVISQYDSSTQLFFVVQGTFTVSLLKTSLDPDDEEDEEQSMTAKKALDVYNVNDNDCFGEVSFCFSVLQPFTVTAKSVSRVLYLDLGVYSKMREADPYNIRLIEEEIHESLIKQHNSAIETKMHTDIVGVYVETLRQVKTVRDQRNLDLVAAMCKAAESADIGTMKRIVAGGHSVDAGDYDNRRPLHVAASKGVTAAVKYIIEAGGDINVYDNFGLTPLYEAVTHSHFEAATAMRELGADMGLSSARLYDPQGVGTKRDAGTLICQICADGDVKLLTSLLKCGLDPDSHDYDGRTGQHIAASTGDLRMLTIMLDAGCNVSCKDNFGRTPLLEAVRANNFPTAMLLWDRGAVLGLVEADDFTTKASDLLAGGEMCTAAFAGKLDYLRMMLQFGINPNACDYDRRTAAHIACAEGLCDAAQILHEFGADFQFKDRWGQSPYDEARANQNEEIITALDARSAILARKGIKAERVTPPAVEQVPAMYVRDLSKRLWEDRKAAQEEQERLQEALDKVAELEAHDLDDVSIGHGKGGSVSSKETSFRDGQKGTGALRSGATKHSKISAKLGTSGEGSSQRVEWALPGVKEALEEVDGMGAAAVGAGQGSVRSGVLRHHGGITDDTVRGSDTGLNGAQMKKLRAPNRSPTGELLSGKAVTRRESARDDGDDSCRPRGALRRDSILRSTIDSDTPAPTGAPKQRNSVTFFQLPGPGDLAAPATSIRSSASDFAQAGGRSSGAQAVAAAELEGGGSGRPRAEAALPRPEDVLWPPPPAARLSGEAIDSNGARVGDVPFSNQLFRDDKKALRERNMPSQHEEERVAPLLEDCEVAGPAAGDGSSGEEEDDHADVAWAEVVTEANRGGAGGNVAIGKIRSPSSERRQHGQNRVFPAPFEPAADSIHIPAPSLRASSIRQSSKRASSQAWEESAPAAEGSARRGEAFEGVDSRNPSRQFEGSRHGSEARASVRSVRSSRNDDDPADDIFRRSRGDNLLADMLAGMELHPPPRSIPGASEDI